MTYQLMNTHTWPTQESASFIEGVMLAVNLSCQPLPVAQWVTLFFSDVSDEIETVLTAHYHQQYQQLLAMQYNYQTVIGSTRESLADFAEGFMQGWTVVEPSWQHQALNDGTERMLHALLMTMMLAIDETDTQQQMIDSGIENPPYLDDLIGNLDMMIHEVASAADTVLLGHRSQHVNPYKTVGRNHACPCGSGKNSNNAVSMTPMMRKISPKRISPKQTMTQHRLRES